MAKIVVNTENLSYEEWLEYRKTGIGGSDASVVCGINKYKSPRDLNPAVRELILSSVASNKLFEKGLFE